MSKKPAKDPEFYKRMLEAKARKQSALEQARLRAEFGELPPPVFPLIVKPENEVKLDKAFADLQQKLRDTAGPTPQQKIQDAFNQIIKKAEGL